MSFKDFTVFSSNPRAPSLFIDSLSVHVAEMNELAFNIKQHMNYAKKFVQSLLTSSHCRTRHLSRAGRDKKRSNWINGLLSALLTILGTL